MTGPLAPLAPLADHGEYGIRETTAVMLDPEVREAVGAVLCAMVRPCARPYTVRGQLAAMVEDLRFAAEELEEVAGWPAKYNLDVGEHHLCERAGVAARAVYEVIGRLDLGGAT